jgi:hypothetical protein
MVLYSFIPYIRTEDDFELKKVQNNTDFMKVFKWYQIQIQKHSQMFNIPIQQVSYVSNKIYFISKENISSYVLEDFIDPDSDGNYPLILSDQQNYLVFGKELSIIDHS